MSPSLTERLAPLRPLLENAKRASTDEIRRVCWGAAQGLPGVIADAFGPLLVVTSYDPALGGPECDTEWESLLETAWAGPWISKRKREGLAGYATAFSPGVGPESVFQASEAGLRFEIRCDPRHDFGVFPDAARARAVVRAEARDARVLNLFSYTCGFGLAAAAGGASDVWNVDASRDYLTWGKRNAALNGLDFRVIPDTAQAFLRRRSRRLERGEDVGFDLVVADPPAFGVGRDADRLLRLFWPEMASLLRAFAPSAMVLLFNDKYFRSRKAAEAFVAENFGDGYGASFLEAEPDGIVPRADPFYLPPLTAVLRAREG